ncbi:twin-arginine translocase TatA/TatE family subunit [Bacillus sp. FJAT-27445]|uniref:twin-arginine translocase TatA/TatE family subunit n=1 Tax=Bacillus sp. FJAT-27445 TaxID=1679166 RepID=UPI000743C793|nr:twin-arginine translocase TatA/TatE family subunit [Bacillus sp. FJAT-27445]
MFNQIGVPGILLFLFVILIMFGTKNLPAIGKSLGESLHSFKKGISGGANDLTNTKEIDEDNKQ